MNTKNPNRNSGLALLLGASLFAACTSDDNAQAEDGVDDSFVTDGKSDAAGITEGSPTALAVLRVVNEADATELHAGALISATAANRIAKHRAGSDGALDTADDDRYDTLTELDAVPYVGPVVFRKLLAYAKELGYFDDPFDNSYCSGSPMTQGEFVARFAALEEPSSTAPLGAIQLVVRKRSCSDLIGCRNWVELAQSETYHYFFGTTANGNYYPETAGNDLPSHILTSPMAGTAELRMFGGDLIEVELDFSAGIQAQSAASVTAANPPTTILPFNQFRFTTQEYQPREGMILGNVPGPTAGFGHADAVTDHCLHLSAQGKQYQSLSQLGPYTEYQAAIVGRY